MTVPAVRFCLGKLHATVYGGSMVPWVDGTLGQLLMRVPVLRFKSAWRRMYAGGCRYDVSVLCQSVFKLSVVVYPWRNHITTRTSKHWHTPEGCLGQLAHT